MKLSFFINLSLASIILTSCTGDPYYKYTGYWASSDNPAEIIQINREDKNTYILKNNILDEPAINNENVLEKRDERLIISSPSSGDIKLYLSEGNRTLRIHNKKYNRISDQEFKKLQH